MLPDSPQQNGIAERRIGMVMDVAPLLWTGKVGDASAFRVWGSRAFVRDLSADKLSPRATPCVFLGFPPDVPGWQFYHPTSRRVLSSQDVTFDESVPYYRLFPYRTPSLPPPPLFLVPGPPPVDPIPPQGPAPSGVSQVDAVEPVEVTSDSGAAGGTEPGGADSGGAELGGAATGGAEPGGAEPGGAVLGGAVLGGAEPRGAELGGAEPGGAEPGGAEPGGALPGAAELRGAPPGGSPDASCELGQQLSCWSPLTRFRAFSPQSGDQQLSCCPSSQLRLRVLPYPPQASRASLEEVMAPRKGAAQVAKKPAVAELPPFEECNVSKTMIEPWQKVASASSADERAAAIDAVVSMLQSEGPASIVAYKVVKRVKYSAVDLNATAREGAMLFISALVEKMGRTCEPFRIELLPAVLVLYSDKLQNVRAAADAAGRAICSTICPFAAKLLLPAIFEGMSDRKNWRTAEGALFLLSVLANSAPRQLARCLPEIVPKVSEAMSDSKEQVRKAAYDAMTDACAAIGNRDIEQFIPVLVSSIARPIEVPETVHKLSATTFVQAVTAPTLSIMVPLLSRGLRDRAPAIKRKSAIITENMSKLIDDPLAAVPFLPKLLPGLELVSKDAADPEIRTVASKAHKTLSVVGEEAQVIMANLLNDKEQVEMVLTVLKSTLAEIAPIVVDDGVVATLDYVSAMCAVQMILKNFDEEDWQKMIVPSLKAFVSEEDAEKVAAKVLQLCMADYESRKVKQYEEEDDEGEELCTCEFSLAYGGKILLNNAGLFLKRGRRYGLCGPNGCGKSTPMRAIANGQLDGFPSPDELKTVYVEHDLDASVAEVAVVDLIMNEPALVGIEREHVVETLASVGFTPEWQASPVAALSGGWKMKLALARAML
ncbi:unnamed protein product [Closterium sp. NIES-53]